MITTFGYITKLTEKNIGFKSGVQKITPFFLILFLVAPSFATPFTQNPKNKVY
jgi:hypothetical protein